MKLISNITNKNHRRRLVELIKSSDKIVLCSGWIDPKGLEKITPALKSASSRKADVRIFTNKKHTSEACIQVLSSIPEVEHNVVDNNVKYLHTKIFYFTKGKNYTVIIGSANLTYGGLVNNEELSIETSGFIDSVEHEKIFEHLEVLDTYKV
ncbi:MAG: phospholipase D-like domain-containing protein [Pseudomonadales bacterium]